MFIFVPYTEDYGHNGKPVEFDNERDLFEWLASNFGPDVRIVDYGVVHGGCGTPDSGVGEIELLPLVLNQKLDAYIDSVMNDAYDRDRMLDVEH